MQNRGKTGFLRQEPIQNARRTPLLGFGGRQAGFLKIVAG